MVEWVRRCATAVNSLIRDMTSLQGRVGATEAADTALGVRMTTAEGAITTLEAFAATPFTLNSVTLTPVALPGSPVKGQTVYDTADNKVKTWDGVAWQPHY
jgi:hypothetical protein